MLKKIDLEYSCKPLRKFDISDYVRELPFAQDPDYRFIVSFFDRRERYEKRHNKYKLSEIKEYFGSKRPLCILYDKERNEANIVIREEAKK